MLRQVHYGQVVIEIERQVRWVKVSLSRSEVKVGWIYGTLVEKVPQNDDIGLLGSIHTLHEWIFQEIESIEGR